MPTSDVLFIGQRRQGALPRRWRVQKM